MEPMPGGSARKKSPAYLSPSAPPSPACDTDTAVDTSELSVYPASRSARRQAAMT